MVYATFFNGTITLETALSMGPDQVGSSVLSVSGAKKTDLLKFDRL